MRQKEELRTLRSLSVLFREGLKGGGGINVG